MPNYCGKALAAVPENRSRSESQRHIRTIGAWLADERIVETQRAGIEILLIEGVGEVLAVGDVLDPCADGPTALAGGLERQPGISDTVGTLRVPLSIEGIEVLLAVVV